MIFFSFVNIFNNGFPKTFSFKRSNPKSYLYAYVYTGKSYFKHILPEGFLVSFPPAFEYNVAEVWKVDKTVSGNGIAEVHYVLLHRVQTQHLHGRQKILQSLKCGFVQQQVRAAQELRSTFGYFLGQADNLNQSRSQHNRLTNKMK